MNRRMVVVLILAAITMAAPLAQGQRPAAPAKGPARSGTDGKDPARIERLKQDAAADVEAMKELSQQMVDSVFSLAELGFQEFETHRYLVDILKKNGFTVQEGIAGIPTAFMASWGSGAPWRGRSALDAVELMNIGWNYRRVHLPLEHRSHYVVTNGGDQPNVVPRTASVWYDFRQTTYPKVKELWEIGDSIAKGAAMMTNTEVAGTRVLGSAWLR